jgi:hypothetical protein
MLMIFDNATKEGIEMSPIAFQDLIPDNLCYGCGPHNQGGLRIKSYWEGDESICVYRPERHHSAGPPQFLNGGIIATFDHIESKLPLGYEFLGEQTVKNIAKPVGAYRVVLESRITASRGAQPTEQGSRGRILAFSLAGALL